MVILYNYLEEGTIKIGVFCCRAPRRGLRIEIAATQISVFRLCVKLRVGACGLKYISSCHIKSSLQSGSA